MKIEFVINLLLVMAFIFDIGLAIVCVVRGGKKHNSTLVFAISSLFVGMWTLGILMFRVVQDLDSALFWNREYIFTSGLIASTFLHFSLEYTEKKIQKIIKYLIYFPSVIILYFLLFSDAFIKDIVLNNWGKESMLGDYYSIFGLFFVVYMVISFVVLYSKYKISQNVKRVQIKYIILAVLISGIVGSYFNLVLILLGNYKYIWVGPYCSFILVALIAYAINRYKLLDIRVFAARFLIFSFVYIPILAIPYAIGYVFNFSWVIPTILQTIFAPSGIFVYLKIQEIAERRILQKEYGRAGEIRRLAAGLARLDNVEVLGKVIVKGLEKITGVKNISLYVLSKDRANYFASYFCGELNSTEELILNNPLVKYLQNQTDPLVYSWLQEKSKKVAQVLTEKRAVVAVPAVEKGALMGIILLGENPDNREYSQIELEALSVLARQVAFAVEIIQFIAEKEEMQMAMNEVQRMKEFRYLTSSIGHEVGNGIQSIADIMSTFFVDPVLMERFSTDSELENVIMGAYGSISGNITNLKMVTGSLKNYIREEEPGDMVNVEMGDLIKRVVVLLKVRNKNMKEMGVSVTGRSEIEGNPGALQSVFYNLLNNSYDAIIERENWENNKTQSGDSEYVGDVTIKIEEMADSTEVRVKDNGIGMSEELQSHIFTPLFTTKSHEDTKDSRLRGGTGIGMETIKKMIEAHRGKIKIAWSEKGKGAEFLIVFPKNKGENSA